ncbi:hypothetical protein EB14_02263 [Enterococcus faecium]|nr:hypothetical protein EB14_02263 [Enterococcus faecium]
MISIQTPKKKTKQPRDKNLNETPQRKTNATEQRGLNKKNTAAKNKKTKRNTGNILPKDRKIHGKKNSQKAYSKKYLKVDETTTTQKTIKTAKPKEYEKKEKTAPRNKT